MAFPTVVLDAVPTIAHWPVRPVIAIEAKTSDKLWDDPAVLWNDPAVLWDDVWRDATCAFTGLEIDAGTSDDADLFPATRAVIQLDNTDGAWSGLNADGTSAQFGPGRNVSIWAHHPTEGDWWLFKGRISRYDQRADDSIEIEAFDAFSDLAQEIGTYTPGAVGNLPGTRLTAILAAAGEAALPHSFAVGTVLLTAQETDQSPLEEMQTVVVSDGGVLFVDVDGTLTSLDRNWRAGRAPLGAVPTISDNVCSTALYNVWDLTLSTNDDALADRVVLENVAGLQAVAGAASGFVLAYTDLQWTTQIEGDILAALLLDDHNERRLSIEEMDLYLLDPRQPELWRAVAWRRLDKLHFLHDQAAVGGVLRVDVTVLIDGILHEITPDGWTMTLSTGKAVTYVLPLLYDTGLLYDEAHEYGY